MMTVKELIEELKKMPQDADVWKLNENSGFWYEDDLFLLREVELDEEGDVILK